MRVVVIFCTLVLSFGLIADYAGPNYFSVALHELENKQVQLSYTSEGEMKISSASKGVNLQKDDYLIQVDNTRMLSGGFKEFFKSGDTEAVVPVIDDSNNLLLGFVMLTIIQPRKLMLRRGEVAIDLEEGGEYPSLKDNNFFITPEGLRLRSSPEVNYVAPPHGTARCITGKDCYYHNGTCTAGTCNCKPQRTGSNCQVSNNYLFANQTTCLCTVYAYMFSCTDLI